MPDNELRTCLTELAQHFVDEVLAAIEHAPLVEITEVLSRGPVRPDKTRLLARPSTPADPAPDGGSHFVRRSGDEIQRLRELILHALRDAGRPVAAAELARQANVPTAALAFPITRLREQGLIEKKGERAQAVYRLIEDLPEAPHSKKKKKHRDR